MFCLIKGLNVYFLELSVTFCLKVFCMYAALNRGEIVQFRYCDT